MYLHRTIISVTLVLGYAVVAKPPVDASQDLGWGSDVDFEDLDLWPVPEASDEYVHPGPKASDEYVHTVSVVNARSVDVDVDVDLSEDSDLDLDLWPVPEASDEYDGPEASDEYDGPEASDEYERPVSDDAACDAILEITMAAHGPASAYYNELMQQMAASIASHHASVTLSPGARANTAGTTAGSLAVRVQPKFVQSVVSSVHAFVKTNATLVETSVTIVTSAVSSVVVAGTGPLDSVAEAGYDVVTRHCHIRHQGLPGYLDIIGGTVQVVDQRPQRWALEYTEEGVFRMRHGLYYAVPASATLGCPLAYSVMLATDRHGSEFVHTKDGFLTNVDTGKSIVHYVGTDVLMLVLIDRFQVHDGQKWELVDCVDK
ncbi:hypothetical protein SARC_00082 [Sphaeroforma arctica JP610]|uniref:Uncharacterized protein n=1 Tax=Sphaeroforma arctica JP610 TaxID=667725 RepID=A0A0L0GFH0_9EUKA|nr:hypothetical protein SARC_00082 [Sphaeroforma arctica JP610]KNC87825.1 hypothetical protein SARC_00082 [Sphaeroforma arctica JP610]|eukprot:XP_014161727.1 hypothetical protein SARC_00082 [Sphaeroforma arctica JP610]